jgi:hypothetical protein
MAVDYGCEYASIGEGGRLLLDLTPIKITGPMVPVVRVLRSWLENALGDAIEKTYRSPDIGALAHRLKVLAEDVEHVLVADTSVILPASKVLIATGTLAVGGPRLYALNVKIDAIAGAIATVG